LFVFICIGSVIAIVWLGTMLSDYFMKQRKSRFSSLMRMMQPRVSHKASNCLVRFIYQIFLEVCICVLINITVINKDSFQSGLLWMASLIIIVAIAAILLLMTTLFWLNGPYVPETYEQGSLVKSYWGIRPLSKDIIEEMEYELEARTHREKAAIKATVLEVENGDNYVDVFIHADGSKAKEPSPDKSRFSECIEEELKEEIASRRAGSSFRVVEGDQKIVFRSVDKVDKVMFSPPDSFVVSGSAAGTGYFKADSVK
jgi:hypothetical protein